MRRKSNLIVYDEIPVTIWAAKKLTKKQRRELLWAVYDARIVILNAADEHFKLRVNPKCKVRVDV